MSDHNSLPKPAPDQAETAQPDDVLHPKNVMFATMNVLADMNVRIAEAAVANEKQQLAENEKLTREKAELADQAQRDPLTGAYNRRFLQSSYDGLMRGSPDRRQAGEADSSIPTGTCMLVVDIDHFKELNDAKGHKGGDDGLVALTKTMQQNTKTRDVVARLGGDEFAVLLPRTSIENATMVADAIREEAKDAGLFTVSIGVGQASRDQTLDQLVDQADIALYVAKAEGRDRVIQFGDLPTAVA